MAIDDHKFKGKYRIASARVAGFDYGSDGYYFVTICTRNHRHYFGEIVDGEMNLSEMGKIAEKCWAFIPEHFPFVRSDESVVMPNHIHGIIIIDRSFVRTQDSVFVRGADVNAKTNTKTQNIASLPGGQSGNLASIVRGFKIGVTKYATANQIGSIWQPRFYDHIIRSEESLFRIREYIQNNPANWNKDEYY